MTSGITRGGVGGGRRMASCVFGAGANELAEASIVASTKVRMTAAATMLVTATGQQDSDGNTRTLTKLLGHSANHAQPRRGTSGKRSIDR
jgi:hypothetical protein